MSKIKELLEDKDSVLVFDIDGVLAVMEWGEYHHFALTDEQWDISCKQGINLYTEDKVSKKMQNFLQNKDMSRIYVISVIGDDNEGNFKKEYVSKFYNIPVENVYCVKHNSDKTTEIAKIKEKYPNLDNYKIVMIDDTVSILNDIMYKTEFSTVHISSFLDI